jgi:hypothetical protein
MTKEKRIRMYANHLALTVRRRGGTLELWERYEPGSKIGTYRSWAAVERAIGRYGDEAVKRLEAAE